ncbi:sulfite exporter TauE/SafE family protein [Mesorhizobium sp. DCY119]|uniref:sulfite exporter TauE/SafE family protein n=1 Tax=Mesorhizobium sp. DCY119 TaxID=2108445 RepID=UPI000E6C37DD|nr:sulfite exporter TauE/SafE family protein [Mesorhizobium sp. DCY119]RJG46182.1 sulfite exporter TauE/SafE family protein [Mesorhizobium sp. DCY119]
MTVQSLIAAVGSGSLVGFTLGLVGGGGSILATPLLLYAVGVVSPHVAIGTGAVAVSVNAYANLVAHARKGHVWWRCAIVFTVVGTLGALSGSSLGMLVDGQRLLFLFGLLMLVVGVLMLRSRPVATGAASPVDMRMCLITGAAAMVAGAASGFFGIGGGFLIVPALILATGMPTINAVGSSLLAVGTFGIATALNYARSGLVDWPLAAEFVAGGIVGGMLGMLLATKLSGGRNALNRVFGALVLIVAAYVIYRNWPAFMV